MILNIVFPFATVLSAYGYNFDIYIGTEGGIARYSTSSGSVEWKYPFDGRVEHVAFTNGNIVFYSKGKLYFVSGGSDPLSPPFEIASVENPKRIGITGDGLIVLDYGGRYRVMDLGGMERNIQPEGITWGSSWRDNSLGDKPGIRNLPLYSPAIGKVRALFLLSFEGRWYVGTDGMGMLVMNVGSLFPYDTIMEGTLSGEYRDMQLSGRGLLVAGNRGIDILGKDNIRSIAISGCRDGAHFVFQKDGHLYAAGCGRIYRVYDDGMFLDITGNIGYERIKGAGKRVFIFYRGELYEFRGRKISRVLDRETYDVFHISGHVYAITDAGIVDVDTREELPLTNKSWLDRFTRADSDGRTAAICTRFGVLLYDGSWKRFEHSMGRVKDCDISGKFVTGTSEDGIWILNTDRGTWDAPYQRIKGPRGVEMSGDTIYIMAPKAIFISTIP